MAKTDSCATQVKEEEVSVSSFVCLHTHREVCEGQHQAVGRWVLMAVDVTQSYTVCLCVSMCQAAGGGVWLSGAQLPGPDQTSSAELPARLLSQTTWPRSHSTKTTMYCKSTNSFSICSLQNLLPLVFFQVSHTGDFVGGVYRLNALKHFIVM